MNIPIYRAKKIDSDEYTEGWLKECSDTGSILWIQTKGLRDYQINPSTLAIHFPDMIDSEGTKIFASLSEDGKGGSNLEFTAHKNQVVKYFNNRLTVGKGLEYSTITQLSHTKVTGIQE